MKRAFAYVITTFLLIGCTSKIDLPTDPIDEKMGEVWLAPGTPPPHQEAYSTPNIALMENDKLWKLISESDPEQHRVVVTLKQPNLNRGFFRGTSLLDKSAFNLAKEQLLRDHPMIKELVEEKRLRLPNGVELPIFYVSLVSKEELIKIRGSKWCDFVEPMIFFLDSLACGYDAYTPSSDPQAQDDHLPAYSGQDLVPYSYIHHKVQEAWTRIINNNNATGWGQGVAILDSGVSDRQEQFFGRYDLEYYRKPHFRLNKTNASIDDACFHGTKVASVAAAPRDGRSIVGIAWKSDLTTVKISHSPLADKGDIGAICAGIADSVKPLNDRPPARVVAMAFGLTYYSPTVAECIRTAFQSSPLTVFIAAAGSTVTNVVFPANYKPFVIAVSMVEIKPNVDGYRLMGRPLTVSYGPEVDFVSVSTVDGIPASGQIGNQYVDQIARFRWSSASTGIYAGIVAVAGQYAQSRGWSREQLLSALQLSASREKIRDFSGEPVQAVIGAGIVDLYRAIGGIRNVIIKAPSQAASGQRIQVEAETDAVVPLGATPPTSLSYTWIINNDDSSPRYGRVINLDIPQNGTVDISVSASDSVDNRIVRASHRIDVVASVPPPRMRTLYWTSYIADWATFLNGGRYDRVVPPNAPKMPEGCRVQRVLGLLVCDYNGTFRACPNEVPQITIDRGNVGFTIIRPAGLRPNDLETIVHQWHDGFSAVRTKVVYEVLQPAGVNCEVPGLLTESP